MIDLQQQIAREPGISESKKPHDEPESAAMDTDEAEDLGPGFGRGKAEAGVLTTLLQCELVQELRTTPHSRG